MKTIKELEEEIKDLESTLNTNDLINSFSERIDYICDIGLELRPLRRELDQTKEIYGLIENEECSAQDNAIWFKNLILSKIKGLDSDGGQT